MDPLLLGMIKKASSPTDEQVTSAVNKAIANGSLQAYDDTEIPEAVAPIKARVDNDNKDTLNVVDSKGNVICTIDRDGVHSTSFESPTLALNSVLKLRDDSFYIVDELGNIIFKADKNGVKGIGLSNKEKTPFKGMKLLTIGDSLSAHNLWQKWLVEWLGVVFDNDENINGKNGHAPMAKGGTAISPTSTDSIYIRALDAVHYADTENGTVIIIYAGQNDSTTNMGTINDTPYTDRRVTSEDISFYARYMGMVENLLKDIPSARIYLMTLMPCRYEIGKVASNGQVRFPTMADAINNETRYRYPKVKAIREIAEKYNLPVIDLYKDSGINTYNAPYWYGAVSKDCSQVHPNEIGYKRMAEVALAKMN